MNGAELVIAALRAEGVDTVFGYPGGAILPFYDALYGAELKHILVRHEQAAAMAADGYARKSGTVGVCVATSGPGATNLVTGIANAMLDSVPMVVLTGQVPTDALGTDAFQEVDVVGITMPIVKHAWLVRDVDDLQETLHEAFRIARSGRPGPVLIDLPKDVLKAPTQWRDLPTQREDPVSRASEDEIQIARDLLERSERPLAYVGGGVRIAKAEDELRAFLAATGMPAVTTLQGIGAVPASNPQCLGMLGMHGLRDANLAVQACDLLVCIGARFDDRVTGKLETFAPSARVIHLDVDPAEVGKRRRPDAPVLGELRSSLRRLTSPLQARDWVHRSASRGLPAHSETAPVNTPALLSCLSDTAGDDVVVATDVGQHQMWVAQHVRFSRPGHHLSSGGLGAMGFGLPAAIGAQCAEPTSTVVCVSGDGSFQMNPQELATLVRYQLPVKIVVLDNAFLGMVRQWQELFADRRYSETDLSDNPDFAALARAYGIAAERVEHACDVPGAIERLLATPGPALLHAVTDREANTWPFVPPGRANHEMLEESCTPS